MSKEEPIAPITTKTETASFISSGKWESSVDSTYNDFFQETSDGNISIWPRVQKSWIEIFTSIMGYVIPLAIIMVLIWAFHVYVQKWWGATLIKENYTFLCPYLNYSIEWADEEYRCDTLQTISASYEKMRTNLEADILVKLNEYIPIKLTKNILLTSEERAFAIETYKNKTRMDVIMKKFEEIIEESQSVARGNINNVVCNGISITTWGNITTQCTIYWGPSWSDDTNGKLGSSRIEALRFISNIADTSKSSFILLNPPTSLSAENVSDREVNGFETRTTISIQAKYIPITSNNKP